MTDWLFNNTSVALPNILWLFFSAHMILDVIIPGVRRGVRYFIRDVRWVIRKFKGKEK